jgi:DNA-binding NarL/FixJ family response regulator
MSLRVFLVDDHRLFRAGLRELLVDRGIDVVGEAQDGAEALARIPESRPDLVLLDLQMPGVGGLEATRLLKARWPELPVVILTASDEDADLFEAVKSGANGYLLKSLDPDTVVDLVRAAGRGDAALPPQLAARILGEFARVGARATTPEATVAVPGTAVEYLTTREHAVLELLVSGESNKEMARTLMVSENTVKFHLKNILQKLHLHTRTQVVSYALRHRLTHNAHGGSE